MNRLYNKNKKGTIILSHYRSGGTQLKEVISNNDFFTSHGSCMF